VKKILISAATIAVFAAIIALITLNKTYVRLVKNPEKAARYVNLAEKAIDSGDAKLAETNAKLALSLNEKSGVAHFILARALSLNRSAVREEILSHFLRAEELGLNSAAFYVNKAEAEMEIGKWEAGERSVNIALAKSPDYLPANYYKTLFFVFNKKDYENAVALATKTADQNPESSATARILALSLYKNGQTDEAVAVAEKAISSNPDYCHLYVIKAEILKEKSISESEAILSKAEAMALKRLRGDKDHHLSNYCLASIYSLKGDLAVIRSEPEELAMAFYEQAMSINISRGKISDTFRQSAINALGLE